MVSEDTLYLYVTMVNRVTKYLERFGELHMIGKEGNVIQNASGMCCLIDSAT